MKIPIRSDDDPPESVGPEASARSAEGQSSQASGAPDTVPSAPEELPADMRLEEIEARLAQKTKEHDALHEQLLRLSAEFENYRKRMARQSDEVKHYATTDLIVELLPGLDNLERALEATRQDPSSSASKIAEGVELVLRQLQAALAKVGVRALHAHGQPFDPTQHEAVAHTPVPPSEDGLVVEELQRGYMLHNRLLRPSKVVVGKTEESTGHGGA
ncbi:MAG: nucleotide exchange factor GrpE [Candidatus Entotheonellia bacterium]